MQFRALIYSIAFTFAACVAVPASALEQDIFLRVNGELITPHDIAQRALFQSLPTLEKRVSFLQERLNALLAGDKIQEKFRQKLSAVQPRTPEEARRITERIKQELTEEATLQVLSESPAARKAAIDALIDDRLKMQTAKRLGIEITDEQVMKSIMVDRMADGEEPDVNAYFSPRAAYGIRRKTMQEITRAQLAWRAVMNRTYGPAPIWERNVAYEGFSRGLLDKFKQHATVTREDRPSGQP